MDVTSLIGTAQDSLVSGLSSQTIVKTKRVQDKLGDLQLSPEEEKKVRKTSQDFESFFIGQMMEHMMAGVETDPMFGGGHGEEMWRSMLTQEYGKELAKSGKLGIADHVMRGMLLAQEQRDAGGPVVKRTVTATTSDTAQADAALASVMPGARAFMPIRR